MRVGYLPDMFGHIAQMPQLLRRAGIEDAVVWRGVPAAVTKSAFCWRAPDGSEVRAEYLVNGYGNAAYLFAVPERFAGKVATYHEQMRAWYGDRSILAMYGSDHAVPVRNLEAQASAVTAAQDRYAMEIETLSRYLERARAADDSRGELTVWTGELRSGARANVLAGVASARIDLKRAAGSAELWLERYAEPLAALWSDDWPDDLLRIAWRKVIENSAHDSISGCSADSVVAQVITRYAEAEQIGRGIAERVVARLARAVPRGRQVIVNPSPEPRVGLVELDLRVPDAWQEVSLELPDGRRVATQEVARNQPLLHESDVAAPHVPAAVARRRHGREMYGRLWNGYRHEDRNGRRELTLFVDDEADPEWLDIDAMQHEVEAAAASATPDERWLLRILAAPRRTVLAMLPVPALGRVSVAAAEGAAQVERPVSVVDRTLDNGLLRVEVEPEGTLRIRGGGCELDGVGRLVDGGDFGDSYNYGPPRHDRLVDDPIEVGVEALARGPVRGVLAVRRTYHWPLGVTADGSSRTERTARTPVTTFVELRAGEPFVRIAVELENRARDHRLRWHVPLPRRADRSAAGSPFAVVERGLEIEGGYGEVPLPTFPARDFVDAGGMAVLLEHVMEYEVVADGSELALTLLRAIGLISRNENPYREDPAGPERPIPAAQCRGDWRVTFALYPHAGDWRAADAVRHAERFRLPFLDAPGRSRAATSALGRPGPDGEGLRLTGDGVALTALRRVAHGLEARVVNLAPEPTRAVLHFTRPITSAREVDLLGREIADVRADGAGAVLDLGYWEIRTVRVVLQDEPAA
jgi:mannosylglycerate hydrolase